MINRTQKLLNKDEMTLKQTNEEAIKLIKEYEKYCAELMEDFGNVEKLSEEYFEIGHKVAAVQDLWGLMIDLGYAKRRSAKMMKELENAIKNAEKQGVTIF